MSLFICLALFHIIMIILAFVQPCLVYLCIMAFTCCGHVNPLTFTTHISVSRNTQPIQTMGIYDNKNWDEGFWKIVCVKNQPHGAVLRNTLTNSSRFHISHEVKHVSIQQHYVAQKLYDTKKSLLTLETFFFFFCISTFII